MKVNKVCVCIDHCNIYYGVRPNLFERRKAATVENHERQNYGTIPYESIFNVGIFVRRKSKIGWR